jgi:hypothetical protein
VDLTFGLYAHRRLFALSGFSPSRQSALELTFSGLRRATCSGVPKSLHKGDRRPRYCGALAVWSGITYRNRLKGSAELRATKALRLPRFLRGALRRRRQRRHGVPVQESARAVGAANAPAQSHFRRRRRCLAATLAILHSRCLGPPPAPLQARRPVWLLEAEAPGSPMPPPGGV